MQLGGGFGRLIDELAGEALNGHLRNVRSHAQLRRRIANGELTEREVNEAYSEYARSTAGSYRKAAADLTLRYYQDLSELGARYSDDFYRQILDSDGAQPRPQPGGRNGDAADDEQRVPIELHGRAGHEIVARFSIENTDPTTAHIQFDMELCRAPHGQTFHAPITIQPAEIELEPGGTAEVLLRVALMPAVFLPGMIYRQAIHAVGGKPLTLDVTIWVEAEDHHPPAPTPTPTHLPTAEPAVAKKAAARRSPTKKKPTKQAAARKAPAKRAAAKKAPAKRASAKKAPAKKAPAKRAPAKNGAGRANSAQRPSVR